MMFQIAKNIKAMLIRIAKINAKTSKDILASDTWRVRRAEIHGNQSQHRRKNA